MNAVVPEKPNVLRPKQKRKLLRDVNFINQKRCGKIKGQTCADGSTKRGYIPREDASSPTISLEALMATLLVEEY